MIPNRGGFTVIEVIIVLAVSGTMLIATLTLFRGKQGQAQFNQAMYDLESKVQSISNEVKSGSFPDSGNYDCHPLSGRPGLTASGGTGTGTNDNCITLGRAIQVVPGDDTLYIYTVLGLRLNNLDQPVSSIKESEASPMIAGHASSTIDLTKEYNLSGGAQVVSSKVSGQAGPFDIVGLYLSPQSGSSGGQGSSFLGYGYPIDSLSAPPRSNDVEECIEQDSPPPCVDPINLGQWELCVRDADDNQRALLVTNFTNAGISTEIKFEDCS